MNDQYATKAIDSVKDLETWLEQRGDPREISLVLNTNLALILIRQLWDHGLTLASVTTADEDDIDTLIVVPRQWGS